MKPRIFIGSSREGYDAALLIKDKLSAFADCQIWDEKGFFENNRSSLESLAEGSVLFDFGVLVATADDLVLKRDALENAARDNVILEYGLYLGRLGRNRAFFVKEKSLSLPSDLFGITLPTFKTSAADTGKTLDEVCEDLIATMQEIWQVYELSFVPSTVLAMGYFENFVVRMCRELMQSSKRVVDGKDYPDFKLHIVIPSELPNQFQDQVLQLLHSNNLKQMTVETQTRPYNFYLDFAELSKTILELYDIPTTLSALKVAIELAIPKGHIGELAKEKALKKKEMNNFCRTLKYLIMDNAITKNRVVIDIVDVS
jgi:hypothetical protein